GQHAVADRQGAGIVGDATAVPVGEVTGQGAVADRHRAGGGVVDAATVVGAVRGQGAAAGHQRAGVVNAAAVSGHAVIPIPILGQDIVGFEVVAGQGQGAGGHVEPATETVIQIVVNALAANGFVAAHGAVGQAHGAAGQVTGATVTAAGVGNHRSAPV